MAFFLTLLAMLNLALGSKPDSQRADQFQLRIDLRNLSPQQSYGLRDSITLEFQIINSGAPPVGVFAMLGMGYQGGLILHTLDEKGAEVEPPALPHSTLDLNETREPKNYFELQPQQFFGTRQKFLLSELVSKPGHYRMLAEYHSPVDEKYAKVKNFWGINQKSVVSSEIQLDVK